MDKLFARIVFVTFLGVGAWIVATDIQDADAVGYYRDKPLRLLTVAILAFLVAAVVMFGDWIRRRWVTKSNPPKPPLCGNCGYNLTGNVSGVCPECGTKITESESSIESD